MVSPLSSLNSLFLSVTILLLGHGLQQTVIPFAGADAGWSNSQISLLGAGYFLGFIGGCIGMPILVRNVGHVRVFTSCIALLIVAVLCISIWSLLPLWIALRVLTGIAMAGAYLIIESWLNERAPEGRRGAVVSLYSFLCIAALMMAQILLQQGSTVPMLVLIAILMALAIVPVALTQAPLPTPPQQVQMDLGFAYRASQAGFLCAGFSGLVMGTLWSAGAITLAQAFGDNTAGAGFLLWMLLGGLVAQLPVGRLSDRFDRRWMLLSLALLGLIASLAWMFLLLPTLWNMRLLAFVLGGTAMPMYAVAVAQANDNADGRFLQIASAMLVANGIGSISGPLLYAALSSFEVPQAMFALLVLGYSLAALWTTLQLCLHDASMAYREPFQPIPKTTQGAAALDPRDDQAPMAETVTGKALAEARSAS